MENGFITITPKNGGVILCTIDGSMYSEVVCRENEAKYYIEVTQNK